MKSTLQHYLDTLQDDRSLLSIRLYGTEGLSNAILRLRMRWVECKVGFVEAILGEK